MTPEFAELRRLAEAATPGPWWHEWVDGDDWWAVYGQPTGDMVRPEVCTMWRSDEAAYIAAANPTVVLALLDAADERDALAAKVERVRALASGMGVPRLGAGTDRDSALTRVTLRSAGHRILRALDEEPQP